MIDDRSVSVMGDDFDPLASARPAAAPGPLTIRVKRLSETAVLPTRSCPDDAGWDLYADRNCEITFGNAVRVPVGIALEIPPGHFGLIRDRSGWAVVGIAVLGGVIDRGFVGEVTVLLHSIGTQPIKVYRDERIAQLLILPVPAVRWEEVQELGPSARGSDGFGSTGR